MKIQRKKAFILGFFILANTFSAVLHAQMSYVVDRSNLSSFMKDLDCEYGDEINVSQEAIKAFFNGLPNFGQHSDLQCSEPEASIVSSTPGAIAFRWRKVPEATVGYHYASFSLDDGKTTRNRTSQASAGFTDLKPDLYLFAFISQCGVGRFSQAFIIIAEKDIFLTAQENPSFNLGCYCDGRPSSLPFNSCGWGTANSFQFSYNNNCPANKYQVSGNGSIGEDQYSSNVFFIHNEIPEPNEILVLSYCTPGGGQGGHGQVLEI